MSAEIARLTQNACDTARWPRFAAILGASPSKGARSPHLWNAAFAAHGVDAAMLPMDVEAAKLVPLLEALLADARFIGGAVAVPFKEDVARWLGARLTAETALIGAANCFHRDARGGLIGTNTDGEGARASFEAAFGPLAGKRVLALGAGGAGKAVAAYFCARVRDAGSFALAGRSAGARDYAARIGARFVPWEEIPANLGDVDVLVNSTSVGAGASAGQAPVSERELAALPATAIVYDIIYQPRPSALLTLAARRGLRVLDGLGMNLEQAVLAYGHSAPAPKGAEVTRDAMQSAAAKLSS